jgi:Tol biopolymer transport system component
MRKRHADRSATGPGPSGRRLLLERAVLATGLAALPFSAAVVTAPAANAAFTGNNGPVAFVSTRLNEGSFGGIFEVNSQASGLGNANGDQSATTGLTNGDNGAGTDAEPFFSPDGETVFFSSNRDASGKWVIYDISTSAPEPPGSPTELSQASGQEANDDDAPSVAPDGRTVVFNRNDVSLDTLDADAPNPPSTVCTLYTPAVGLAAVSNGRASRALFNPQDPTELLYVGGDNHLHLVTGLPAPSATAPTNPCGAVAGQHGVTDTDLSAEATDSVTGTTDATGSYQDENPDWSPNGNKIVFDSTRGGTNHTLWQMTSVTSGTPTVTPLWPGQVGSGQSLKSATEPVYSPDGTSVAFVEPGQGQNTWTGEVVGMGQGLSDAEDVSLSTEGNGIINDQPDWGPAQPTEGTPEVSRAIFLPGVALLIGGLGLAYRRRRQAAHLRRSHAWVSGRR